MALISHNNCSVQIERASSSKTKGVRLCEWCGEKPQVAKVYNNNNHPAHLFNRMDNPSTQQVVFDDSNRAPVKACKECTALLHRDPHAPKPSKKVIGVLI